VLQRSPRISQRSTDCAVGPGRIIMEDASQGGARCPDKGSMKCPTRPPSTLEPNMPKSKGLLGLGLTLLLLPVGFVAGGLVASVAVTETGLAAGGIVFGYMLIGGVVAATAGIIASVMLPREVVGRAIWGALGAAILAVGFVGFRVWQVQREAAAAAASDAPIGGPRPVATPIEGQ